MILTGDCLDLMPTLPAESIAAIVTDPPYGLEFMGKKWDKLGGEAGQSRPGIGDRPTEWTTYGGDPFGGANPTCAACGGRRRGENRCSCEEPDWRVRGERVEPRHAAPQREMQDWHHRWAVEALRVAKPGAHLLAFGGTRTYHRLACAIEDAGWEVRDCLVWAYASGFPKSLDVSKAMDKAAGAEREVTGPHERQNLRRGGAGFRNLPGLPDESVPLNVTAPATDLARQWQGWGTALKPAWEPIILARKPLRGTVAGNVAEYGTGALNIDGCRIGFASEGDEAESKGKNQHTRYANPGSNRDSYSGAMPPRTDYAAPGRWPANLILTDPIFDGDAPGVVGGGDSGPMPGTYRHADGEWNLTSYAGTPPGAMHNGYGDSGTYSRFFLVPKASRADREPKASRADREPKASRIFGSGLNAATKAANPTMRANHHPTVKPTELMRHLVRLVTPPGGTVLDPFLGSGTTAVACEMEGFDWIGIERESEYVAIAEARLSLVQRGLGLA